MPHHQPITIGLLQMTSGIDPLANAAVVIEAAHRAAAAGAAMLFAPEMSLLLDRQRERAAATIASGAVDQALGLVAEAARAAGIVIHMGSAPVPGADGRLHNRSHVFGADGETLASYDKLHLFDVQLESGEEWRESAGYAPGEQPQTVHTPLGLMGLTICYDLRFASLFDAYGAAECAAIAVPAAFTVPTGQAHWHVLLRARAIEQGCFVIAAAQCGDHADGRSTYGHSLVVDPWGQVLHDSGGSHAGLALVDLDISRVNAVRAQLPAIRHRRPIRPII